MALVNIVIRVIPHEQQRYETCGDWIFDEKSNTLDIKVSDTGDWKYNILVGLHEAIEAALCKDKGITGELVDQFDFDFEAKRLLTGTTEEAGDALGAPYRRQHFVATTIERQLALELGVDWNEYEEAINSL